MFGCLRWLLVGAIAVLPVTVDLRRGFTWSEASAQDIWSLNCDPVVLNYYSFNRFVGSQVRFRTPPPNCVAPTCVLWGACISEVRLDNGLLPQSKLNPQWLSFENLQVQACRVVRSIAHSVTAATSATMSASGRKQTLPIG
jgi:hypothetical protein